MELHLFILLFFTGVIPLIQSVTRKYILIQQSMTWSDAQAYCRDHHTDLFVIESDDDMIRLQEELQNQQFSSSAWIGLYREHVDPYWSYRDEPLGSVPGWIPGEPDNPFGTQWCIRIMPEGWGDGTCVFGLPFMCFDETKTGNQRYIYISTGTPWYEAQAYCRNHYTDLAIARDATEHADMLSLVSGSAWIGLIRESWKWINQATFSTLSWASGEPDLTTGDKTCGAINNGEAVDELCTNTLPFICYRDIIEHKQIMKMKVRSNTDVNDPAVMDAIMEQIQQKLEEHGLAVNVTVKWRMHPDGKVFHKTKNPPPSLKSCDSLEFDYSSDE